MVYQTTSARQTRQLGKALAKVLHAAPPAKAATVVRLRGQLGAGKTTFTQGFMRELGVLERVNSPTFVLLKRFILKKRGLFTQAYHVDCYRLGSRRDPIVASLRALLEDRHAIFLVEWPQRLGSMFSRHPIIVSFRHGKQPNDRRINIVGVTGVRLQSSK